MKEDVDRRRKRDKRGMNEVENTPVLPFSCLEAAKTFLSYIILEKWLQLPSNGSFLKSLSTSAREMLGMIVLHVLCASYDEALAAVCHPEGDGVFSGLAFLQNCMKKFSQH